MGNRKIFSDDFKNSIVLEVMSEEKTHAQIAREHNVSAQSISRWKRQFGYGRPRTQRSIEKTLGLRIERLERKVGQLVLENEVLKKTISLARQNQAKNGILSPSTRKDFL